MVNVEMAGSLGSNDVCPALARNGLVQLVFGEYSSPNHLAKYSETWPFSSLASSEA
jgi:hypothetical protein